MGSPKCITVRRRVQIIVLGMHDDTHQCNRNGEKTWTSLFLVAWIPSPRGGGCLPAFFEFLGALSGTTLPPPGGGRPRVGWDFWGKTFVTRIFMLPLSCAMPDLVSTLAVLQYICNMNVLGSNPGHQGNYCNRWQMLGQADILWGKKFKLNYLHCVWFDIG